MQNLYLSIRYLLIGYIFCGIGWLVEDLIKPLYPSLLNYFEASYIALYVLMMHFVTLAIFSLEKKSKILRVAEWLENLVCPDQGVVNVMLQEFNIPVDILPDVCNCLPSNPKYLDKTRRDVLIYHCAGGGVRFWTYTWNGPWQKYYKEYLAMGGEPHTDVEHAWLKFIKKYNLQRFKFFDRSPDPKMHPHRFLKYVLTYPFKYGFKN